VVVFRDAGSMDSFSKALGALAERGATRRPPLA